MLMKRTNFKETEINIFLQTIRGNANAGFDFYVDHVRSNEMFGGHFLRKSYGRLWGHSFCQRGKIKAWQLTHKLSKCEFNIFWQQKKPVTQSQVGIS